MAHHGEVMGDEQARHAQLRLQLHQQVENLRTHRNIQRAHRLVTHQQRRAQRQGAGDDNALALAAGELMRQQIGLIAAQPDLIEQCQHTRTEFRPACQLAHQ